MSEKDENLYELLFDNGPTLIQVEKWKEEYGYLFMTEYDDGDVIIWRAMKDYEKELIITALEEDYEYKKERVFENLILWPNNCVIEILTMWKTEEFYKQVSEKCGIYEKEYKKCEYCDTENLIDFNIKIRWKCLQCGNGLFDFEEDINEYDNHNDYSKRFSMARHSAEKLNLDIKDDRRIFMFIKFFPSFFLYSIPDESSRDAFKDFYFNYDLPNLSRFSRMYIVENQEDALWVLGYTDILAINGHFDVIEKWAKLQDEYTYELIIAYCNFWFKKSDNYDEPLIVVETNEYHDNLFEFTDEMISNEEYLHCYNTLKQNELILNSEEIYNLCITCACLGKYGECKDLCNKLIEEEPYNIDMDTILELKDLSQEALNFKNTVALYQTSLNFINQRKNEDYMEFEDRINYLIHKGHKQMDIRNIDNIIEICRESSKVETELNFYATAEALFMNNEYILAASVYLLAYYTNAFDDKYIGYYTQSLYKQYIIDMNNGTVPKAVMNALIAIETAIELNPNKALWRIYHIHILLILYTFTSIKNVKKAFEEYLFAKEMKDNDADENKALNHLGETLKLLSEKTGFPLTRTNNIEAIEDKYNFSLNDKIIHGQNKKEVNIFEIDDNGGLRGFKNLNINYEQNIIIPLGVKKIMASAFKGCENIRKVVLPDGIKKIEIAAFKECTNLMEINIPETVRCIEKRVFEGCRSLKEITIPEGINEIGEGVFDGCSNLLQIKMPESLKYRLDEYMINNMGKNIRKNIAWIKDNSILRNTNTNMSSLKSYKDKESNNRTNIERTTIEKRQNSIDYSHFHTKVVGVTVDNRQEYIRKLYSGKILTLKREPNNTFDKNAIAVMDNSIVIGYIKKEIAYYMASLMDDGYLYYCKVDQVTGGGNYNYGLNIKIDRFDI